MKTEISEQVGKNLAVLRRSVSLSQSQVAEHLKICRTSYAKYEQGQRLPDMKTMCDLSKLYHISIDTLINQKIPSPVLKHFLHSEFVNEEAYLMSIYNSLSKGSKEKVSAYLKKLTDIEARQRMIQSHL